MVDPSSFPHPSSNWNVIEDYDTIYNIHNKNNHKNKKRLKTRRKSSSISTMNRIFITFFLLFLQQHTSPALPSSLLSSTIFVTAGNPVNINRLRQDDDDKNNKRLAASNLQKGKNSPTLSQSSTTSTTAAATETATAATTETKPHLKLNQILIKAGKRGIGGGIPGAIAGAIQVLTLMWLRTIINYQYRYGTNLQIAFRTLYNEGGIPRFYRGLWFALIQAPLSRFASTAANDGVESLLASFDRTENWGPGRGTILASFAVGLFRILLMPVDTCKVILQVESAEGLRNLMRKVRGGKIGLLYSGAFAQATSAIIAHYPWFFTYNSLSRNSAVKNFIKHPLLRNASIGFLASVVSDTIANSMRVIKTTKQTVASKNNVGYGEAISMILAADGWKGLFGRGLRTRILANGFQSVVFTVLWRILSNRFRNDEDDNTKSDSNKEKEEDNTVIEQNESEEDKGQEDNSASDDVVDDIDSYD